MSVTCNTVLLVDDDEAVRTALGQTLELSEIDVQLASSFLMAKDAICSDFSGVIVTDIRMPGRDGFHLLEYAHTQDADLPVILLTGEGDIPMAVRAMQKGAFDFLEKPCAPQDLIAIVRRALDHRQSALTVRFEQAQAEKGDAASRMLFGVSQKADEMREEVRRIAKTTGDVLVTGKPGTGTYKFAEVIHLLSAGSEAPFVKRSAAALDLAGLQHAMDLALGGSLFLDEVSGLSAQAQFELLEHSGTMRLIAGTYRDLRDEVEQGRFNHDLMLKLELHRVHIPSLADRPEDIPSMFRRYVAQASEQADLTPPEITPAVIADVMAREWPGNARALMNGAMRFAMGLDVALSQVQLGLAEQMAQTERTILTEALTQHKGRVADAMDALKLPRKTLYDRLAKHNLKPEDFR
jgi:two-component system C4-dicarboxylate transport response regulator DctD